MRASPMSDWPDDYQEQFWKLYPRRIAKAHCMKALDKVKKQGVPWEKIVMAIAAYSVWLNDPCWRPEAKHPATWLNAGCWDDELPGLEMATLPDRERIR